MMRRGPEHFYDSEPLLYKRKKGPKLWLPATPSPSLYKRRVMWDFDKDLQLLTLFKSGLSQADVAATLAKRWEQKVTRGMVSSRVREIRAAL